MCEGGVVVRYLHGLLAMFLWCCLLKLYLCTGGKPIPNDLQILTSCIITAGAMAGGVETVSVGV